MSFCITCPPLSPMPQLQAQFPSLPDFSLPTLPSPLFADQNIPSVSNMGKVAELATAAILMLFDKILQAIMAVCNALKAVISPLAGFLDELVLFKIPGLDISLPDFLALGNDGLAALQVKLAPVITNIKLAFVPDPFMMDQKNPVMEAMSKIQAAIRESMTIMLTTIINIIKSVTDTLASLNLPGLPTINLDIPTSLSDLFAMTGFVMPSFDGVSMPSISIPDLFASFTIPGLDIGFEVPSPIFPDMSNFSLEFVEMMKQWQTAMLSAVMGFVQEKIEVILSAWNAAQSIIVAPSKSLADLIGESLPGIGTAMSAFSLATGQITFCA